MISKLSPSQSPTQITVKSYNCDKCKDEGYIYFNKKDKFGQEHLTAKPCECLIKRNNEKRVAKSNVSELFRNCTFTTFEERSPRQKEVKELCIEFYKQAVSKEIDKDSKATAILLLGQVGAGKTHLAVAMMNNFIANNYNSLYTNYKDLVRTLSQNAMDKFVYKEEMDKCINADVLLIDEFFKCDNISELTSAQKNYMYEIINTRYNNRSLTILTSEKSIQEILQVSDALGSRLFQMANQKYVVDMTGIANQRMI